MRRGNRKDFFASLYLVGFSHWANSVIVKHLKGTIFQNQESSE